MGLPPKGEIVGREMVARACGCMQEFHHYAADKYRAQRLEKFQRTRCPTCAAKLCEQPRQVRKGEALGLLPPGARVSLTLQPDGSWAGTLAAEGATVERAGEAGAGPQAVVVALARMWLSAHGSGTNPKPGQPPA